MALEDLFVEDDVQDMEARFDRLDREFAITNKRRVIDWDENGWREFMDDDD